MPSSTHVDFRIDQKALESEIGPEAARLRPVHAAVKAAFGDFVDLSLDGIFVHRRAEQ